MAKSYPKDGYPNLLYVNKKPKNEKINKDDISSKEDFSDEVEYDINDLSYNYLINTHFKNINQFKYCKIIF